MDRTQAAKIILTAASDAYEVRLPKLAEELGMIAWKKQDPRSRRRLVHGGMAFRHNSPDYPGFEEIAGYDKLRRG